MNPPKKNLNSAKLLNLGITEEERQRLIRKYKNLPRSVGQKYAIDHLNGIALTPKQAAQAECFTCMNGIKDCINIGCPYFKTSAYKDKDFRNDNPERIQAILEDYENNTIRAKGNRLYVEHLQGKKLTPLQLNHAKCAECTAGHADGRKDCKITSCPLYPFMPYRGKE